MWLSRISPAVHQCQALCQTVCQKLLMLICSAIGIAIRHCDKVHRYQTGALMQQLKVGVLTICARGTLDHGT